VVAEQVTVLPVQRHMMDKMELLTLVVEEVQADGVAAAHPEVELVVQAS
tara:strand:+ start:361 stop:507 length:147 start_codon:yes stop_codon:yes gene_type:complete